MGRKRIVCAVLASLFSVGFVLNTSAYAAEEEKVSEFVLDTFVVEATREKLPGDFISKEGNLGRLGNKNIMDAPFSQTNFIQKTIETFNNPSAQLTDVLINDPSVKSSSYTLYNDFSIRGIGMTGYNLYVNGVPGMFTQSTIPTNFIERVEVTAGPSMGMNGTTVRESAGGLVNMVSKRATDENVTSYTQTFSGEDSFGEKIDVSRRFGQNKEWGLRINAENVGGHELNGVDEKLTNRDLFINLDHEDSNSKTNLLAGYSYSNLDKSCRWFQFGSAVSVLPKAPENSMNYAYDGQGASLDRWIVTLNHEQKISEDWVAYFNGGFSRYDLYRNMTGRSSAPYTIVNNEGDFNAIDRDGPMKITNYYAEMGIKGTLNTGNIKHDMIFSLDKSWSSEWSGASNAVTAYAGNIYTGRIDGTIPSISEANVLMSAKNIYWGWALADTMSLGKAQLMLGVHGQHASVDGYSQGIYSNNVSTSGKSPIFGLLYKPEENISLYVNHSESFGKGSVVTNTKYENIGDIFSPSKTKQNELGVKYENKGRLYTFAGFDIKKAGLTDEIIDSKTYCVQDGEDEYKGVQAAINGRLAKKWNWMGGIMYLNAKRNKTSNGQYDGYRVNGASKWNGVLSLEYNADSKLSVIARGIYNGTSTINNESLSVPAYLTFDLGISYKTKVNSTPVTLSLMCYNITDKNYWLSQSGLNYLALGNPRTLALTAQFYL